MDYQERLYEIENQAKIMGLYEAAAGTPEVGASDTVDSRIKKWADSDKPLDEVLKEMANLRIEILSR